MSSPRPIFRQLTFFLLAVLLPSAVLLSFGVVLLRQENELNERRLEELEAFAVRQYGDSLFQTLERAASAVPDSGWTRWSDTSPSLLIIGHAGDGALTPRPARLASNWNALRDNDFDSFFRSTLQSSMGGGSIPDAISRYERRLAREDDPARRARLELAISLSLSRLGASADKWDLRLLDLPSTVADEYGLPFAYYGAQRLLERGASLDKVRERLRQDLTGSDWIPSDAWITLRDLVEMAGMTSAADSLGLAELLEEHRLARLAAERPLLLAQNGSPGPSWFPLPGDEWLIRRIPLSGEAPVVAVPVSSLQPPGGSALVEVYRGGASEPDE